VELDNIGVGPAITIVLEAAYPTPDVTITGKAPMYAIAPGANALPVHIPYTVSSPDPERPPRDPNPLAFRLHMTCLDRIRKPVPNPLVEPEYENPV
jgi:hypothetical protein